MTRAIATLCLWPPLAKNLDLERKIIGQALETDTREKPLTLVARREAQPVYPAHQEEHLQNLSHALLSWPS